MPSLLKETQTLDSEENGKIVISRDAEDRIDARLHPACDVKGGRPTTRFVEAPQKQKDNKVISGVSVHHIDKVVCSVSLHRFVQARMCGQAHTLSKIEVEGKVDNEEFWRQACEPSQLEKQEMRYFLTSPECQLKRHCGMISIKILATYKSEPSTDQIKACEDPKEATTDHYLEFIYRKGEVGAPALFDPKWLPAIPYEPKRDETGSAQDACKPLKRVRIAETSQDQSDLDNGPAKRRVLAVRENEIPQISRREAGFFPKTTLEVPDKSTSKETAKVKVGYAPPVPLMRNILQGSSTRRNR